MKKTYQVPQSESVRLNVSGSFLDEKFGNNTYVPVGNVDGDDDSHDDEVDEMYGKSFGDFDLWDD